MFKNMKIGVRLGLGFGLVLLLLSVIAFTGITRLTAMNDAVCLRSTLKAWGQMRCISTILRR